MEEAVTELGQLLEALEAAPDNVPLLRRQVELMRQVNMTREVLDVVSRLSTLVMLSEAMWLGYLSDLIAQPETLDNFVTVLEKFELAEQDYLSLAILQRHIDFLLAKHEVEVEEFLTEETKRGMLQAVVQRGAGLLSTSHLLWQPWLEWEKTVSSPERIHNMFMDRLAVPHTNMEETASTYSSYCSENSPNEYEQRMVQATEASQGAKAKLQEKRFGKTREDFEQQLVFSTDLTPWSGYIAYETDQRTKKPDVHLTRAVFERAIAAFAVAEQKDLEAGIWSRYAKWDSEVLARAVRACPESAALWARLQVTRNDVFVRAISLGFASAELYLALATVENRRCDSETAFAALTKAVEFKDPSMRAEKFLLDWAETTAPERLDQALALVDRPKLAASYQMTILRAAVETRRGNIDAARHILSTSIARSDLDWPEAVYETFMQLENIHGTLSTTLDTERKIEKEQEKLLRRREKAAAQYAPVQYVEAVTEEITAAPPAVAPAEDLQYKRDREHTTVLVNGIGEADAPRVEAFFQDCGPIRETTILPNAALVEFRVTDAVPAALARRKMFGREIHVTMLWRSTLFITNFPKDFDDKKLRELFQEFGAILQTRWPSKKYAESRRFAYVTLDSPAAAQNALSMHGRQFGDFGLTVLVSDPSAKAKRTDANNVTLFVGGLAPSTVEQDIRTLFGQYGPIHHIKLGYDPAKQICKGFAFVEMTSEADAKSSLVLHGMQLNNKLLKVTMADPNRKKTEQPAALAEKRSRTIRLHNLPEGTQEGLLQQALGKIVPVKRVELFARSHEAIAELENPSDVGLLLMRPDPFVFEGATITFTEQGRNPKVESSLTFAPRPRKGIGKGRQAPVDKAVPNFVSGGQDDFRALVDTKNKQREVKLEAQRKRPAEDELDAAKKPRIQ